MTRSSISVHIIWFNKELEGEIWSSPRVRDGHCCGMQAHRYNCTLTHKHGKVNTFLLIYSCWLITLWFYKGLLMLGFFTQRSVRACLFCILCLTYILASTSRLPVQKFFFGGRLVFGPDAKSLLVTVLLILIPAVLFCTLIVKHIRHEFNNAGYAILVVAILLAIYVLGLLLVTSARDPGIVPRASHPPEEDFNYESTASVDASGRHTPSLQFPRTKEVHVNGMVVRVKYCDTCMLYRPPRCSHCSICNNCVEKFDHHCPWVGQCIGRRNYRYFFMFVSSATILCIYVFSISALYIKILMDRDQGTVWRAMKESPASVALMAYCFISLWFVGGLTGFHLYLIGTNQTTYENFRYRADSRLNVYNLGCVDNFMEVFCTKINPSKNKFRSFVQQEVQRPPTTRTREQEVADETGVGPRSKIEDDLELGGDLQKISQRRNVDENNDDFDIRSRGSNVGRRDSSETADLFLDQQNPSVQSDARHSSWGRRSGSWEIAPDVAAMNAAAAQSRSNNQ